MQNRSNYLIKPVYHKGQIWSIYMFIYVSFFCFDIKKKRFNHKGQMEITSTHVYLLIIYEGVCDIKTVLFVLTEIYLRKGQSIITCLM